MFNIIPSKLDAGKINGLFGNYNGNSNDDFQKARNGNTVNNQDDFFNSFKYILQFRYYQFLLKSNYFL